MNTILRPFAPFAFFLLGSILAGQGKEPAQERAGPPVLSLSEIVLDQYSVQNVDPDELFDLAEQMVGRSYYVKEHGGHALSSLRLLGTKIVLYDTQEQVKRARELLARLDEPRETTRSIWKSVEYRPRFVSLKTVMNAIDDLVGYSSVPERGLVVMNDDAKSVDSALAVLNRIDVPSKQVFLTCHLVEVGGTPQGPLPKELVDNLQRLLPQSQFTQTGLAMLKTSVGAENKISLSIESPTESFRLDLTPVAFDEGSASLTVEDCRFTEIIDGAEGRELFNTNTVLRGGEYTVLAATGPAPKLLVLRVSPQG